jgi:hypothetical protein
MRPNQFVHWGRSRWRCGLLIYESELPDVLAEVGVDELVERLRRSLPLLTTISFVPDLTEHSR